MHDGPDGQRSGPPLSSDLAAGPVHTTATETMAKRKILVVEDEAPIRRGIVDALRSRHYDVLEAPDGEAALDLASTVDCDLVLLDLMLPGKSGLEVLREVREVRATLPVIILTALGDEADRVRGLKLGADDYIVKPFSIRELLARIEAVLRRSPERPTDLTAFDFPGGTADLNRRELRFHDGSRCDLSEREAELLRYLVCNAGRAIAREEILARVWRISPAGVATRTIDMHVARLRDKLRDDPTHPAVLLTVRGKGYMFAARQEGNS
jgi:DNA-binding response OmpR family regulator